MDWNGAIERNSETLKRIVAALAGMAGISAAPTSPSRGLRGRSSDRASGSIVGREGRGDCGAIEVPGGAAPAGPANSWPEDRLRGAGGGDTLSDNALPNTPTRPSGDGRPPPSRGRLDHPTLPRRLHRYILRLLRPAESAVRRLIVIAARGLVVSPSPPPCPRPPKPKSIFVRRRNVAGVYIPRGTPLPGQPPRQSPRSVSFPLFDPLQRPFRSRHITPVCEPRISYAGPFDKLSPVKLRRPPTSEDSLDATRLTLRLDALAAALDDLPKQARRLARWRANQARDKASNTAATPVQSTNRRFRRLSPLRPGRPPGSLRRPDHEVHQLLTDLHGLAFYMLEHPDTS